MALLNQDLLEAAETLDFHAGRLARDTARDQEEAADAIRGIVKARIDEGATSADDLEQQALREPLRLRRQTEMMRTIKSVL